SRMLHIDMQRLLGEQQFSMVSFIADTINDELAVRLRTLEQYASVRMTPAILGSAAAMQARLEESPTTRSLFNGGVWIARQDGIAIASVPPGRIGTNFMDRDYMRVVLREGKSVISEPIMGKVSKAPNFVMAVPIHDAQSTVIGVLVGVTELNKANFLDKISQGRLGKTGSYVLADNRHKVFLTSIDKRFIMQPFPPPGINPLFDRYTQGFEGFGQTVDSVGVEVLSSSRQIPIAGWFAIARIPTEEAFAPIHDMHQRILMATIFMTMLAGGLTWWMLRRQFAPMLDAVKSLASQTDTKRPLQPLTITRDDEIGELIGGFNRVLNTLTQREAELVQHRDRLASFAVQQDHAIEDERKRLAREVHDQIGAVLTAIKLIVSSLPREAFPSGQEAALTQALTMGIATTRKITAELRPPLLDDLGLSAALDHLGDESAKVAKLSFEIDIDAQSSLNAPQALALFRIAQESVTNIMRHAGATHVVITGRRDGNRYILCIEDNGSGFVPTERHAGAMGLKNMGERALLLGGHCEISPRPQGGTSVTVTLPLGDNESDEKHSAS
ncbi:MAG: cache domain-containing protein, partial [Nitrospirae bacterium]|nr:cache domain-containing protein [Nitrospirota bacterium]